MSRLTHGGRHELGQNHLTHRPTIDRIESVVNRTSGPILEIGAGDGVLSWPLTHLGRPITATDIDEHRVKHLRRSIPDAHVEHADVIHHRLDSPVVVGNIPFHLTTPILRKLLSSDTWTHAVLLTQWEVARKRAGIGGRTMKTAQSAPWFEFTLEFRVPHRYFTPVPSVDGGVLGMRSRASPLVSAGERRAYERCVRAVFTGRGGTLPRIVQRAAHAGAATARRAITCAGIPGRSLPRDLDPAHWSSLRHSLHR